MFDKVLIANRGEIAVRIVRACRELGVGSVAVYSDADRLAPHVLLADEAYEIGPAPAVESYLDVDRLLDAAARCGADAIHPGYGFLAENADFARAVEDAGCVFVGPPADAIAAMGDKTRARTRMIDAGVPVVPGTADAAKDADAALRDAADVGYPVLLKAAAGGGGKGMRVVESEDALPRAFEAASREAQNAFGDGSVYVERYLEAPRHVEIQVLGDRDGRMLHLGERECSIQRRHQKMVEEAPSPVPDSEMRDRMGAAAVAAAAAVGYHGAGTVEFLYQGGEFFFLEMNTRLQVEHPVTELITGLDLVHWQLRIAARESLSIEQADVRFDGHAVECRITSENPVDGFLPSAGRVEHLRVPAGPGVRWDGGITEGSDVSLHYDPMLAKLIVHAEDRDRAIARMRRALDELRITGVETSVEFHRRVMREPDFRAGRIDVRYIEGHPELLDGTADDATMRIAALAAALFEHERRQRRGTDRIDPRTSQNGSRWRELGWRQ